MTNREAIKKIKLLRGFKKDIWRKKRDQYTKRKYGEEVEALDMAIAAMEKQEPKEPYVTTRDDGYTVEYFCPTCSRLLGHRSKHNIILFEKEAFCQNPHCGQHICWRNVE